MNILTAFEALEEERLGVTRNSIWRLANVSSAASVADDEAAESVRQTLETNNLADVFKEFVDNEGTGNKRPKPGMVVKLVNYRFYCPFYTKDDFPPSSPFLQAKPSSNDYCPLRGETQRSLRSFLSLSKSCIKPSRVLRQRWKSARKSAEKLSKLIAIPGPK